MFPAYKSVGSATVLIVLLILLLAPASEAFSRENATDPLLDKKLIPPGETSYPVSSTGENWNVDLAGRWAEGACNTVVTRNDTVFAGNGAYLEIINFFNAMDPVLLGRIAVPGLILDLDVDLGVPGPRVGRDVLALGDPGQRLLDLA